MNVRLDLKVIFQGIIDFIPSDDDENVYNVFIFAENVRPVKEEETGAPESVD